MTTQKKWALALFLGVLFCAVLLVTVRTPGGVPSALTDEEAFLFGEDDAESFGDPADTDSFSPASEASLLAIRPRDDGRLEARISNVVSTRYYAQGERLSGSNIELTEILDNAVLLRKGAVYQLLCCTPESFSQRARDSSMPTVVDLRSQAETTHTLRRYYGKLFQNPMSLIGTVEIESRQLSGNRFYHVFPGTDPKAFSDFGLQAGDRILGVNGVDLAQKQAIPKLFGALAAASHIVVTLQRDGREFVVLLALDDSIQQTGPEQGTLL